MAFSVACKAAVGDLLTKEDLDYLFPLAEQTGNASFSPVSRFAPSQPNL